MPRIRVVNGIEEFYTAEEDAAQDKREAEWEAGAEARNAVNEREVELEAKLSDDSISFDEMKELMRLRG
tara:strand:- start:58 stop:264 length:207 start_codon:yes stop_codon:yes gene_type:complete